INESEISPLTINAMLRSALLLVDHTEQDTFSGMISFMKGDHSFTAENAMHWNIFIALCLHHYFSDYEAADRIYDKVFNSPEAKGAYPIALTDAIRNAWYVEKDKYSSWLFTASNIGRTMIEQSLNSFSINDTELFWYRTANSLNNAYGLTFNLDNPDQFLMTGAFLNAVFTKSLSIQTYNEMMKSLKNCGDSKFREIFDKVTELRRKLGNTTDEEKRKAIASELSHLEWTLRIGYDFSANYGLNHNKTVMMASGLDADECEVEIVEYPKIENGKEVNSYGAIICSSKPHVDSRLGIAHRVEHYEFVYLGPVDAWQLVHTGLNNNFDDKTRAGQYLHNQVSGVGNLISPLLNHILKYKKAYVSPTGILSMINIGALPWGNGDSIVNDKVEIIRINAAYDVQDIKKRDASLNSAAVFHNIDFNSSDPGKGYLADAKGETSGYRVSIEKGGPAKKFHRLPIDGEALTKHIKKHTKKIDNYPGASASEDAFKKYDGKAPDLIHFDTHGFYIPDGNQAFIGKHTVSGTRERALLTCGLAMSGCNHAWAGEDTPAGKEDGILTAWEIACMDLSDCKLAVLSACETAQGDVDRINGVLGLQRALKIAGVKSMLLTLWSVDNELTEEFINGFYKRLPNSANFNEAFVETQKEFRKRHPDPYHWAPFMLIN
ncbi:MAG: CHAT domain-containing protein, partial [Muribaculaceae bacterium]|nr:CHAT domain-containing protein [Muribaculaceae bacterium]